MARPLFSHGFRASGACWMMVLVAVLWSSCSAQRTSSLPASVEQCDATGCSLQMSYNLWPDRSECKATAVVYPTTEAEIVAAVASAVKQNKKIKVSSTYGHSIPKLACPGSTTGVIISSKKYTAIEDIDLLKVTVTAQGGILLRDLADAVATRGLALPVTPSFDGVSLAGLLSTGAHGSTLFGKGANLHEHVIGMRIVTPASKAKGYAVVRVLGSKDKALLRAARVSLGVLGVISTVTIQLEYQFKRSVSLTYAAEDAGMEDEILRIARTQEFGDVLWYPSLGEVTYKLDHRVDVNTVGEGVHNYIGMLPTPVAPIQQFQQLAELADTIGNRGVKCDLARASHGNQKLLGSGFFQNGVSFTGFPVIGPQNRITTSGGCQRIEAGPEYACPWDSRINGLKFFDAGVALPLRHLRAFIADVKALRAAAPQMSLCEVDAYTGLLIRFAKKQTAYMGPAQEDMAMLDFAFSRGSDPAAPRLDTDVFQELEQIAFLKYGGRPHWGKNRPHVFNGVRSRYKNLSKFLAVKKAFDPKGLFSSEWSDAILGIKRKAAASYPHCAIVAVKEAFDPKGLFSSEWSDAILGIKRKAAVYYPHCAIEGVCRCKTDEHCNPAKFSFCRPGLVYAKARVCRTDAPLQPPPDPPGQPQAP